MTDLSKDQSDLLCPFPLAVDTHKPFSVVAYKTDCML